MGKRQKQIQKSMKAHKPTEDPHKGEDYGACMNRLDEEWYWEQEDKRMYGILEQFDIVRVINGDKHLNETGTIVDIYETNGKTGYHVEFLDNSLEFFEAHEIEEEFGYI